MTLDRYKTPDLIPDKYFKDMLEGLFQDVDTINSARLFYCDDYTMIRDSYIKPAFNYTTESFSFILDEDGKAIGFIQEYRNGYSRMKNGNNVVLGYSLVKEKQGQGLMKRALDILIKTLHTEQKNVFVGIRSGNEHSLSLAKKLGFEKDGYTVENDNKGNAGIMNYFVKPFE